MVLPKAFVQQNQLARAIAEVEVLLSPNVARIRYELGDDWTGDPAVFFRIILSDDASREDQLWSVTNEVSRVIEEQVEPLEQWGVLPYSKFSQPVGTGPA